MARLPPRVGVLLPGVIESLEQELGKPVVSSNSASWWALTVALDIAGPISGPGRLFQTTGG